MAHLRIIAFRHGQTDANKQGIIQGTKFNFGLNDEGRKQAEELAKQLITTCKGAAKIRMITSPLKRALETATIIYGTLSAANYDIDKPLLESGLSERSFGHWEGTEKKLFKQQVKDSTNTYNQIIEREKRYHFQISPQIETDAEVVQRIHQTLLTYSQQEHSQNTILLVSSHGNILRTLKEYIDNTFNLTAFENGIGIEITVDQLHQLSVPPQKAAR